MLKLFISQPMKGNTDEEILQERNQIISMMRAQAAMEGVTLPR